LGEGSTTILLGVHRKRGGSAEHLIEMEIWSDLTGITVSCRKAKQAVACLFEHFVVQGEIDTFLGFQFIRTERIGVDANSDHKVLFYAKSGLLLATGAEPQVRISERDDKNYSTQVFASMTIGATRMQEKLVGYIECDPS